MTDIQRVLQATGIEKGIFSVQVGLETKEIVCLSSQEWKDHRCFSSGQID
ncbi:MAG: hypothetical protein V4489_01200 [Chlamydiota bacterium]